MTQKYRALVHFDATREVFVARAPELPECAADGASRSEAIAALDAEIEAQVSTIIDQGGDPPTAVDTDPTVDGQLSVTVSAGLHRELLFRSRADGVSLDQLVGELLAGALGARARAARGGNQRRGRGRRDGRERNDDRRGNRDGRYQQIMDDKASFLEYVRGLDQGDGNTARGGGSGRRGRGGRRRDEGRGGGGDNNRADSNRGDVDGNVATNGEEPNNS